MFSLSSSHPFVDGPSSVMFIPPPLSVEPGLGTVCFKMSFSYCREQAMFKNVFVRAIASTRDGI